MLNDQQFYELAQGLAARLFREGPKSDADRLDFAFRLCLARLPKPDEKQILRQLLAQQLASNESISGTPTGFNGNEFAAWTTVSRVLLNLDETITRE